MKSRQALKFPAIGILVAQVALTTASHKMAEMLYSQGAAEGAGAPGADQPGAAKPAEGDAAIPMFTPA